MALTKRQLEVLQQMAAAYLREDWDEAEIAEEGIETWLGGERIGRITLKAFIDHTLVSADDFCSSGFQRWSINDTGLLVARKPEMADPIWLALRGGKPFTFKDDAIVYL